MDGGCIFVESEHTLSLLWVGDLVWVRRVSHDRAQGRRLGAERKHPHADAHASEDAPDLGVDLLQEEVKSRERSLDVDRGKDVGSSTSSSSAGVDSNWAHDVTFVL